MTPLEAAKALARDEPMEEYSGTYECRYCQAIRIRGWSRQPVAEHAPDCPWLQMGAIVEALEGTKRHGKALL